MSAATTGRHTRKPGNTHRGEERRRWRDRLRRRGAPAPEPGHPYGAAPSEADITELIAGLPSVAPDAPFSGVSLPDGMLPARVPGASLGGYVPRPAGHGAWAERTPGLLGDLLGALRDLDDPAPAAFVRRAGAPERLSGRPVYLGTAPAAIGHVAEIGLGFSEEGGQLVYAADRAVLDEAILVLVQARDSLVYGSGIGSAPAAEPPAAPQPAPAGPETAEAPAPEPAAESSDDPHASLISRATGMLGRAAFLPEPEDPAAADEISSTIAILTQALNLYRSVSDSTVEPFWVFADLAAGEDASKTAALERLSADIADAQEALIEVTRRYRDDETAALVAGQAGA